MLFVIVEDSFVETDDGTLTCVVKCPISHCNKKCTVSYKSYRPYYKPTKKQSNNQRPSRPKWHLYGIEKHIRQRHIEGTPNPPSGDENTSEEISPDFHIRENQNEDSSSGIIDVENANRDVRSFPQSDDHSGDVENRKIIQHIPKKRAYHDESAQPIHVKRTRCRK